MEVNRRFFMAMMAGAAMDPEQLLWVPGRKMISIAAPLDVVPIETLFGMPDLLRFDVPLTERVRALLAIDPTARSFVEGSGTVRFIEDVHSRPTKKENTFGFGRIVIPGRDTRSAGAYVKS